MKKEKWVVFREETKLVDLIDNVVERRGTDRSDFIREAVRKRLAEIGFLPDETKIAFAAQHVQKGMSETS